MDLLSNMISIIKNGCNLKLKVVEIPNSNLCVKVLLILYKLGFINGYSLQSKKKVLVYLKYINNKSCIRNITRISTPGHRVYMSISKFKNFLKKKGNGFYIFSTSKGIITDEDVPNFNIGGEVLLRID
jgi:small subunit ribosomal protein S8